MSDFSDWALGRMHSWTGQVICDKSDWAREHGVWGHYFRCSSSYRDQHTGAWEMRWDWSDYLGPRRPRGEKAWVHRGNTWDLSATMDGLITLPRILRSLAWTFGVWGLMMFPFVLFGSAGLLTVAVLFAWVAGLVVFPTYWLRHWNPARGMLILYIFWAIIIAFAETAKAREAQSRAMLDNPMTPAPTPPSPYLQYQQQQQYQLAQLQAQQQPQWAQWPTQQPYQSQPYGRVYGYQSHIPTRQMSSLDLGQLEQQYRLAHGLLMSPYPIDQATLMQWRGF